MSEDRDDTVKHIYIKTADQEYAILSVEDNISQQQQQQQQQHRSPPHHQGILSFCIIISVLSN